MSQTTRNPHTHSHAPAMGSTAVLYAIVDAVLIVAFAVIGRLSHGENAAGFAETAWPFLVGGLVGWLVIRAWRQPQAIFPSGVIIWVATVVVGMLLRAVTGYGTHWSFIIVATIATGVFLLGFRLVMRIIARITR
ncbi:DUF3054 domain-containing protein [Kocuria massiliensis]|uniref:DUF3054 domain-containing protein n=1 Tax=Kocuria massiliensis TaxID=1926282 RepID=UPI0022B9A048|nr:DUF3054 domain-containing protein [Kocuria massiliensis]